MSSARNWIHIESGNSGTGYHIAQMRRRKADRTGAEFHVDFDTLVFSAEEVAQKISEAIRRGEPKVRERTDRVGDEDKEVDAGVPAPKPVERVRYIGDTLGAIKSRDRSKMRDLVRMYARQGLAMETYYIPLLDEWGIRIRT